MPDPRLITDYTPSCIQEQKLKNRLHAGSDRDYRHMLQDRATDIIHSEAKELSDRSAIFQASIFGPVSPLYDSSYPDRTNAESHGPR